MIAVVAPVSATAPQETASEVERALGALRVGEVVQAHVDAILKDGIARLVVASSALNIRPTIQLVPGTPVSLALKHGADGSLELELYVHAGGVHTTYSSSVVERAQPFSLPGRALLGALLNIGASLTAAQSVLNDRMRSPSADSDRRQRENAQLTPPIDSRPTIAVTEQSTASSANMLVDGPVTSDTDPQSLASAPQGLRGAAVATEASQSVTSFVMPGTTQPLQIIVTREKDDQQRRKSAEPTKSVTVRFTWESEGLGPVHAVLRQHGNTVSIGLWVERPEAASELRRDSADLRSALSEGAVDIESLDVHVGRSAPAALTAGPPSPLGTQRP